MPFKNLELSSTGYTVQRETVKDHTYKGFSTIDPYNSASKLYDFNLIKQNIINHFNTRKGERVMNPTFGTIIWDLIMEPLTPQVNDLLTNDIKEICNFDPRVTPLEIKITEYEQGYLVEISLLMKSTNETSTLRLAFDQKIGLRVQ